MVGIKENPSAAMRQWTLEDKQRWLLALANEILPGRKMAFPIMDEADKAPIAFLLPRCKSIVKRRWWRRSADFPRRTAKEKETLLAALATDLIAGTEAEIPVLDQDEKEVASLVPARDLRYEGGAWTLADVLMLQWAASTPERAMPWSEFERLLAKDLGAEAPE